MVITCLAFCVHLSCLCVCECEGDSVSFQSLASLAVGEESYIVGTLCKRMDLKPSILKAVTQEVSQQAYCVCPVVMLYCNPSMNIRVPTLEGARTQKMQCGTSTNGA